MNSTYTQSDLSQSLSSRALVALLVTGILFGVLPFLHIAPNPFAPPSAIAPDIVHDTPPEFIVEAPPEDPPEKKKPEVEDVQEPVDPIVLEKILNGGLKPGTGSITVDYDFRNVINTDGIADIFELPDLDRQPRSIFQVEPNYPYTEKQAKIAGWVVLEWIITERGGVTNVRVVKSSHRAFEQPAIDSILKSKWEPGEVANKPVNTRVRQKITFNP